MRNVQFARSSRGVGPACSTGNFFVSAWCGGMRSERRVSGEMMVCWMSLMVSVPQARLARVHPRLAIGLQQPPANNLAQEDVMVAGREAADGPAEQAPQRPQQHRGLAFGPLDRQPLERRLAGVEPLGEVAEEL